MCTKIVPPGRIARLPVVHVLAVRLADAGLSFQPLLGEKGFLAAGAVARGPLPGGAAVSVVDVEHPAVGVNSRFPAAGQCLLHLYALRLHVVGPR